MTGFGTDRQAASQLCHKKLHQKMKQNNDQYPAVGRAVVFYTAFLHLLPPPSYPMAVLVLWPYPSPPTLPPQVPAELTLSVLLMLHLLLYQLTGIFCKAVCCIIRSTRHQSASTWAEQEWSESNQLSLLFTWLSWSVVTHKSCSLLIIIQNKQYCMYYYITIR